MPRDLFNREIDYLRISVIDRCNLRCVYCMPLNGIRFLPKADLLTPAEIEAVVQAAVSVGFRKFRLTGGEPTLRLDLLEIVERIARVPGVGDLALTTNAILMRELAGALKAAGLSRVNVHLDSLIPVTVERQMRGATFAQIWQGIEACEAAGLTPIKINAVVTAGYNEADVVELARLTLTRDWHVRFIELMPLGGGECATLSVKRYVSEHRNAATHRDGAGAPVRVRGREFVGRSAQLRATRRPRRHRLHQPGKRTVLRYLQPDASYRRRKVSSLPAQ